MSRAIRSPQALVEFREGDSATFTVKEVAPEKFSIGADNPDISEQIATFIDWAKGVARDEIQLRGSDPARWAKIFRESDEANPVFWAAKMYRQINAVEGRVKYLKRSAEGEALQAGLRAVLSALLLSLDFHKFTVADNERSIVARIRSIEGAAKGGPAKAANNAERNREWAEMFLKRKEAVIAAKGAGRRLPSDFELKKQIAKELGRSQNTVIDGINHGLESIPEYRGKPD